LTPVTDAEPSKRFPVTNAELEQMRNEADVVQSRELHCVCDD